MDLYSANLNDEAKLFIQTIRSSTLHMNQLIEDFLDYSRLDRSQLSTEQINLKELIVSILGVYGIEDVRFKVEINVGDIEIAIDPKGITIALRNLIENAIKFTRDMPLPMIKFEIEDKNSAWIISIEDNGIGFDMKYHQKIFEIFQRLHCSEDFPGTGIGLALVSKAMYRMKGSVWAESSTGNGSTFYLKIPKKTNMSTIDLNNPILIVEDNLIDLDLIKRAFAAKKLANPIQVARDGEEALAFIERWENGEPKPVVILLDLNMPKMQVII